MSRITRHTYYVTGPTSTESAITAIQDQLNSKIFRDLINGEKDGITLSVEMRVDPDIEARPSLFQVEVDGEKHVLKTHCKEWADDVVRDYERELLVREYAKDKIEFQELKPFPEFVNSGNHRHRTYVSVANIILL